MFLLHCYASAFFDTKVQAESQLQLYKGQLDAGILAQQGLELQNNQLLQDNSALEDAVMKLRSLLSDRMGGTGESLPFAACAPSSTRDLALIAHLESRAKGSEQRAESMLFQKNEVQSRFS